MEIGRTMWEVIINLDMKNEEIKKRMESPEYLRIMKKCFRDWSAAESEKKRRLVRNLLINAASTRVVKDDMVMLFISWIDEYTEAHFEVIREIYHKRGITRKEIATKVYNQSQIREDSAEADLFKLIIHDLSVGHIARQHREKDAQGNFLKERRQKKRGNNPYVKTAFDDEKQYELTALGEQFVHYTMNEETIKITGKTEVT